MKPSAIFWLSAFSSIANAAYNPLDYVDPLIGTVNGGHVFPGATLPFGMAKAVADVDTESQGGFASDDGSITGFSHMHDSGTGGGASLGNFPLFPQSGCPDGTLDNCIFPKALRASSRKHGSALAEPGYFTVTLNTSIKAEMTVSNHSVLYKFTFPSKPVAMKTGTKGKVLLEPLILADLTDLSDSRGTANISVDAKTGRITGSGQFNPSFGIGSYILHFCTDFDGASIKDTGVFRNNRAGNDPKSLSAYADGTTSPPTPAGAWVQFNKPDQNNEILARVGVSFISRDQACSNAEKEIPKFDFDGLRKAATAAWAKKFSVVTIDPKGVNETLQKVFWSGMYRSMISPQDYTGENPLWKSKEPYYDSYYCIWDSFRSIHPLITLLDPNSQTQMVRSLIDIYRHEGHLPDCRMSLCKGYTQGGSNADVVLADSYLKGLTNGIDWKTGLEAVVTDAEDEPPIWTVEGRGGLKSWKSLGYIPADDFDAEGTGPFTRSISRTVEYGYNDFCIAEMAQKMGRTDLAEKYEERSGNLENLFKADQKSALNLTGSDSMSDWKDSGFTGFLQPKFLNKTWGYQDASLCSPMYNFTSCYLNSDGHETYEGSSWLYTLQMAPHQMAKVVSTLGGPQDFVKRLQYLHTTPNLLYFGDEQAFLLVYLFHYASRPGLSSYFQHYYIPSQFNDTTVGIPGNDDSGAMGSYSTLAMMGLWPMPGQNVYLINAPFFKEVSIKNGITGKTATVKCVNHDGGKYKNLYIQSATLNGKKYTQSWVDHSFYTHGGVLELTLGDKESKWGTAAKDMPPGKWQDFEKTFG